MAGYYIIADIPKAASELVGYARRDGADATVLALASDGQAFSECGAASVKAFGSDGDIPENYAHAAADMIGAGEPSLVLVSSTVRGRDIAARIAGYLDCAMASDASSFGVDGETVRTERMTYGGAVVSSEESALPCVITLAPGMCEPASGASPVEAVDAEADSRVTLVGREPLQRGTVDLNKAERVVCVGLGMKEKEDMGIAQQLADSMGADIACTRSIAEERAWLPTEAYIGISGAIIKPKLYLALGVSGQVQHVFGIRESGCIAAIDTDENAPIFKAADYGVVGDLCQIAPLLAADIQNGK